MNNSILFIDGRGLTGVTGTNGRKGGRCVQYCPVILYDHNPKQNNSFLSFKLQFSCTSILYLLQIIFFQIYSAVFTSRESTLLLTSFILAFLNLNVAFKLISRIFLTGAAFLFDKLLKIYTLITAALAISIIRSYITPTIIARDSAFPSNASEISWKGNYFLVGLCLPLSRIMPLFFLHENFVTTRESSCYFHYIEVSTHFLFFLLI